MNDDVFLVTPPDDVAFEGFRILAVHLNSQQSKILSDSLLDTRDIGKVILYSCNIDGNANWLFDKKIKCDLIFFNAEHENQTIVGYMAAQKNSFYFGTLKTLGIFCKNDIYSYEQCCTLIKKHIQIYEQKN